MVIEELPGVVFADDDVISEGGDASEERYGWCYWQLPTGWIVTGQDNLSAIESQQAKGMVRLPQFGKFPLNPQLRRNAVGQVIPAWSPRLRPWDRILEWGGAEMFPVEQIIAHHWHRGCWIETFDYFPDGTWRKHRRKVNFPQIAGLNLGEGFRCPNCPTRLPFNTEAELRVHRSVMHQQEQTLELLAETQRGLMEAVLIGQRELNGPGGETTAVGAALAGLAAIVQQQGEVLSGLTETIQAMRPSPKKGSARPAD
jgi:hypothetical protein